MDIVFFKRYLSLTTPFGLCLFRVSKRRCINVFLSTLLSTLMIIFLFIYLAVFVREFFSYSVELGLNILEVLTSVALIIAFMASAVRSESTWEDLFTSLTKVDAVLETEGFNANRWKIIAYHFTLVTSVVSVVFEGVIFKGAVGFFCTIFYMCSIVQKLMFFVCVEQVTCILRRRYYQAATLVDDPRTVKFLISNLHETVSHVNAIFGVPMLFFVVNAFTAVLNMSNSTLYTLRDVKFDNIEMTYAYLAQNLVFWIELTVIIRGWDDIGGCHEEILTICCELEVKSDFEKELIDLRKNLEGLRPVFTAAGFFELNQGFFASCISTFASYLIMTTQIKTKA